MNTKNANTMVSGYNDQKYDRMEALFCKAMPDVQLITFADIWQSLAGYTYMEERNGHWRLRKCDKNHREWTATAIALLKSRCVRTFSAMEDDKLKEYHLEKLRRTLEIAFSL